MSFTFVQQVSHRQANLGGDAFFRSGFDMALWMGFAITALVLILAGLALFFGERETIVSADVITVRDMKGIRTRRYTHSTIQDISTESRPLFAVFGNRATVVGTQYCVALRSTTKRKPIILSVSRDRDTIQKIVLQLAEQFKVPAQTKA